MDKKKPFAEMTKAEREAYNHGWTMLYGNPSPDYTPKKRNTSPKVKRSRTGADSEYSEQCKLVAWLKSQKIRHHHSPNEGKRTTVSGYRLRMAGMSPGFPDITIPLPSGNYHGLYIEMKRKVGGKVTPQQQDWLNYLRGAGYFVEICRGFEEAKEVVLQYLGLTPEAA